MKNFRFIDLTHTLHPDIPTWNGSCGFCLEVKKDYDRVFKVQQVKMHAGVGTHVDAPSHRFEGAKSIADIALEELIAPACVIDVSAKADANYLVSVADVEEYEKQHGKIGKGSLVIAYTGWSRFWSEPVRFRNEMKFPTIFKEAAELFLKRGVVGVAIDTLSPDAADTDFPVHKLLLGKDKYIIENIANCDKMPASGAYVITLPVKMDGATEAAARIIGVIAS